MTGEKNRFKTTEKLWDLDDKQLKSPQHDAMVLWLMDETNLKNTIKFHCKLEDAQLWTDEIYTKDEVITDVISIVSEKPIVASSNGFIGGYADLTGSWKYTKCVECIKCPLDIKWVKKIDEADSVSDIEKLVNEYGFNYEKKLKRDRYIKNSEKWWVDDKGNRIEKYNYRLEPPEDASTWEYITVRERYNPHQNASSLHLKILDFMLNTNIEYETEENLENWATRKKFFCKVKSNRQSFLIEVKPYIDSFGAVLRQIKSYKEFVRRNHRYDYDFYFLFTFDDRFDKQFESQGITVLHPPADVSIDDMRKMYGL